MPISIQPSYTFDIPPLHSVNIVDDTELSRYFKAISGAILTQKILVYSLSQDGHDHLSFSMQKLKGIK